MIGSRDCPDSRSSKDDDAIERARGGDRAALEDLLGRHVGFVRDRVRDMVSQKKRSDHSDLVQSAILRAIEGMSGFKGSSQAAFLAWLGSIVSNTIRQKRRYHSAAKRGKPTSPSGLDTLAALTRTPSTEALNVEALVTVGRAMQVLNPQLRRAFELRLIDGVEYDEIAAELGVTESVARATVSRARATLAIEIARLESGLAPSPYGPRSA